MLGDSRCTLQLLTLATQSSTAPVRRVGAAGVAVGMNGRRLRALIGTGRGSIGMARTAQKKSKRRVVIQLPKGKFVDGMFVPAKTKKKSLAKTEESTKDEKPSVEPTDKVDDGDGTKESAPAFRKPIDRDDGKSKDSPSP